MAVFSAGHFIMPQDITLLYRHPCLSCQIAIKECTLA